MYHHNQVCEFCQVCFWFLGSFPDSLNRSRRSGCLRDPQTVKLQNPSIWKNMGLSPAQERKSSLKDCCQSAGFSYPRLKSACLFWRLTTLWLSFIPLLLLLLLSLNREKTASLKRHVEVWTTETVPKVGKTASQVLLSDGLIGANLRKGLFAWLQNRTAMERTTTKHQQLCKNKKQANDNL